MVDSATNKAVAVFNHDTDSDADQALKEFIASGQLDEEAEPVIPGEGETTDPAGDDDGDGVSNDRDVCPDSPAELQVSGRGDGDGLISVQVDGYGCPPVKSPPPNTPADLSDAELAEIVRQLEVNQAENEALLRELQDRLGEGKGE